MEKFMLQLQDIEMTEILLEVMDEAQLVELKLNGNALWEVLQQQVLEVIFEEMVFQ